MIFCQKGFTSKIEIFPFKKRQLNKLKTHNKDRAGQDMSIEVNNRHEKQKSGNYKNSYKKKNKRKKQVKALKNCDRYENYSQKRSYEPNIRNLDYENNQGRNDQNYHFEHKNQLKYSANPLSLKYSGQLDQDFFGFEGENFQQEDSVTNQVHLISEGSNSRAQNLLFRPENNINRNQLHLQLHKNTFDEQQTPYLINIPEIKRKTKRNLSKLVKKKNIKYSLSNCSLEKGSLCKPKNHLQKFQRHLQQKSRSTVNHWVKPGKANYDYSLIWQLHQKNIFNLFFKNWAKKYQGN